MPIPTPQQEEADRTFKQPNHRFDCAACREQLLEYIRGVEKDFGIKTQTLDTEIRAIKIVMGNEKDNTGLFGAMNRAFAGIAEANNKLDEIVLSMATRKAAEDASGETRKTIITHAATVLSSPVFWAAIVWAVSMWLQHQPAKP